MPVISSAVEWPRPTTLLRPAPHDTVGLRLVSPKDALVTAPAVDPAPTREYEDHTRGQVLDIYRPAEKVHELGEVF